MATIILTMRIIIVGGGKIGKNLAEILSKQKNKVVLIEKDKEAANELAASLDVLVLGGDGTDMAVLEDAKIKGVDAVIAVTGDDKTNLMVCEIAKNSDVGKVIARVNSPGSSELFVKLGVSSVIPVTENAVSAINNALSGSGERIISQIGEGKAQVIELTVAPKSPILGKRAKRIGEGLIGTIYRDGAVIVPDRWCKIEAGDVLTIMAKTENIPKLVNMTKEG